MSRLHLQSYSSLQDALHAALEKFGGRTALIEVDRDQEKTRLTYIDLQQQSIRFTNHLISLDFQPGDKVAIIMSNQSKWISSAIGSFYAGAVLCPLDYKSTPEDQIELLRHSETKFVVTEYPFYKRLRSGDHNKVLQSLQIFVTEAPTNEALESNVTRLESIQDSAHSEKLPRSRSREDVACIVYSSGTGGTPKGCMLMHGNYLTQAQSLSELYPIDEKDTYFSFIPTNHAIDFMCGFLLPLFFGSKIVHQRTLRPEFFPSTIQTYKISHMALVPLLLKNLEQKIRDNISALSPFKKKLTETLISLNAILTKHHPYYWLSRLLLWPIHKKFGGHLRLVFAGGAFVESSTAQFFYNLGIPVVIGYGLTEAGTVLTVNDLKPFRGDTVGKPLLMTQIKINNPDEFSVGEVWAKGPTVMKGYWKADELTNETFEGDWLKTGDLGKWDGKHLMLVGRQKNMIVTAGGKNVYPEDIETNFDRIDEVEEYCILAKRLIWPTSDLTKDSMVLVIRPKEEKTSDTILQEIRERNRKLADYKRVSEVLLWKNPFDRTASMKIKRIPLADQIAKTIQPNGSTMVSL